MEHRIMLAIAALAPLPTLALENSSVQNFGINLVYFLEFRLIPFLFAVALLLFVFNIVRYFIINIGLQGKYSYGSGTTTDAKDYALWGLIGMILMTIVWGIVNLFTSGLGLQRSTPICPDFLPFDYCTRPVGAGFGDAVFGSDPLGEFGGVARPNPFSDADFGGDPRGEFGGAPQPNPFSDADFGTDREGEFSGGPTLDIAVATAQLKTELTASLADPRTLISILDDEDMDIMTKVSFLEDWVSRGFIERKSAHQYIDSLNQVRAAEGLPHVFINLPTDTGTAVSPDTDTTEPASDRINALQKEYLAGNLTDEQYVDKLQAIQVVENAESDRQIAFDASVQAIREPLEASWKNAPLLETLDQAYDQATFEKYQGSIDTLGDDINALDLSLIGKPPEFFDSPEFQQQLAAIEERVEMTGANYRTAAQEILDLSRSSQGSDPKISQHTRDLNVAREDVLFTYTNLRLTIEALR